MLSRADCFHVNVLICILLCHPIVIVSWRSDLKLHRRVSYYLSTTSATPNVSAVALTLVSWQAWWTWKTAHADMIIAISDHYENMKLWRQGRLLRIWLQNTRDWTHTVTVIANTLVIINNWRQQRMRGRLAEWRAWCTAIAARISEKKLLFLKKWRVSTVRLIKQVRICHICEQIEFCSVMPLACVRSKLS